MAMTEANPSGAIPVTPPGETAGTQARRGAAITLVIICAAVFLTALDQTVVVTALIPIADSFRLPINDPQTLPDLSWVVSGYLLGYVIMMPLMGRVSDIYGRRRVLIGCLIVFAVASLLCAEALNLGNLVDFAFLKSIGITSPTPALVWLVLARFIQAVGGGAVVPVAIAAIGDLYGDRRRILALGIIGGATEAGGALGPLYGALILDRWKLLPDGLPDPWQWIFVINVPLVALIIGALWLLWPRQQAAAATTGQKGIDWLGAVILGGSLFCFSLGLGQEAGAVGTLNVTNAAQNNFVLLGAAAVLLVAFILWEARSRVPLVSLSLFRSRAFSSGALYSLLLGMALIVALVEVPIYIFTAESATAYFDAGFALLRMTIMIPIGAFAGGLLVARIGTRIVGVVGALLTAIGFFIMHHWGVTVDWTQVTLGTVLTGVGFGLIVSPISTTALNTATAQRFGMAASIVTALRMVGMILGLAILSSWGVGRYREIISSVPLPTNLGDQHQLDLYTQAITAAGVHLLTDFFLIGSVLAAIAIIPAIFLWKPKPGEEDTEEHTVLSMGL